MMTVITQQTKPPMWYWTRITAGAAKRTPRIWSRANGRYRSQSGGAH